MKFGGLLFVDFVHFWTIVGFVVKLQIILISVDNFYLADLKCTEVMIVSYVLFLPSLLHNNTIYQRKLFRVLFILSAMSQFSLIHLSLAFVINIRHSTFNIQHLILAKHIKNFFLFTILKPIACFPINLALLAKERERERKDYLPFPINYSLSILWTIMISSNPGNP